MSQRSRGGFSTEVMIALSLAAILIAVGAPVYSNYRKDSRRQEARAALEAVLAAEEAYYRGSRGGPNGRAAYTLDRVVPPSEAGSHPLKLESDPTPALADWDVLVTQADERGFTAIATGRDGGRAAGLTEKLTHMRTGETRWDEN